MKIVVQKYGGSSVGDLDKIGLVADRIVAARAQADGVVVVVSAIQGETDRLLALAHALSPAPPRRELDMLLSTGERTSMALLAVALIERGIDAVSLTGSQSGIVTDEAHAGARVLEVRPARIREELARGRVVVVGGFQGVSRMRDITTLGRGGSDTTAVVLAAALDADYVEICSDVDGVWTSDPRLVPEATKLDALELGAALALTRGGAKVLYEDAVRMARDLGVSIVASSSFGPGAGTRIEAGCDVPTAQVAVALDVQLVEIVVNDPFEPTLRQIQAMGGRIRRHVDGVLHVDTRNAHGPLAGAQPIAVITAVESALGEDVQIGVDVRRHLQERGFGVPRFGGHGDTLWWQMCRVDGAAALPLAHRYLHQATAKTHG